jgi:Mitochondrial inner membrane protein
MKSSNNMRKLFLNSPKTKVHSSSRCFSIAAGLPSSKSSPPSSLGNPNPKAKPSNYLPIAVIASLLVGGGIYAYQTAKWASESVEQEGQKRDQEELAKKAAIKNNLKSLEEAKRMMAQLSLAQNARIESSQAAANPSTDETYAITVASSLLSSPASEENPAINTPVSEKEGSVGMEVSLDPLAEGVELARKLVGSIKSDSSSSSTSKSKMNESESLVPEAHKHTNEFSSVPISKDEDSNGSHSASNEALKALEEARSASDTWVSAKVAEILRKDLKDELASGVELLTPDQLRIRLLQVISELRERTKWEALRFVEYTEAHDREWEAKFKEFSAKKTRELEEEARREISQVKDALSVEYQRFFDSELEKIRTALEEEKESSVAAIKLHHEKQADEFVENLTKAAVQEREARSEQLRSLQGMVDASSSFLKTRSEYEAAARRIHAIALSTLALVFALEKSAPVTLEVAALSAACGYEDPVFSKAISLLPHQIHSPHGIPTKFLLQSSFPSVARAGRIASYTPENSGVFGPIIGNMLYSLLLPSLPAQPVAEQLYLVEDVHPLSRLEKESKKGFFKLSAELNDIFEPYKPFLLPFTKKVEESYVNVKTIAKDTIGSGMDTIKRSSESAATSLVSSLSDKKTSSPSDEVARSGDGEDSPSFASALSSLIDRNIEAAKQIREKASEISAEAERNSDVFFAAEAAVANGNLERAVGLLSTQLNGRAADVVAPWVEAAKLRIATDDALSIVKARTALLTASAY